MFSPPTFRTRGLLQASNMVRARRVAVRTMLRIEQSIKGLFLVAELTSHPELETFAHDRAVYRRQLLEELRRAVATTWKSTPPTNTIDIAGTLHRLWMRFLARGPTSALLLEIDRGEAAAEKAVRSLLATEHEMEVVGDRGTLVVEELLTDIELTRDFALALERTEPPR